MLKAVLFISNKKQIPLLNRIENGKSTDLYPQLEINNNQSFDLQFTFNEKIVKFRNHDYTWVEILKDDLVANQFTPKIIQLESGILIQANINLGVWEVQKSNNKVLLWRFNPENSNSLTTYSKKGDKFYTSASSNYNFLAVPQLLFTNGNTIEFSRSEIPFKAIACFTDHCDFDTTQNLEIQRLFFAKHKIKVTKGFFLNHFSKRSDNASFENEGQEFLKWQREGHELAYHSLSQSIKNDDDSFNDFKNCSPPLPNIPVWIDHGFQPYNLSLYQNYTFSNEDFETNLVTKQIKILWNYIDSGTATLGVINQLNKNDFTLNSFYKGTKSLQLKERLGVLIKNMMFHYYADEKIIKQYQSVATYFKYVFLELKLNYLGKFISSFGGIIFPVFKVLFSWFKRRNVPYKLAKYSPLVFKHRIHHHDFYVFQTLEMIDFKKSLCKSNLEKLVAEQGVFVAHTYFSVPLSYHKGRMFKNPTIIDEIVDENFGFLAQKIANQEIWNPTLSELITYLSKFEHVVLDLDENNNIYVSQNLGVSYRKVN